MAAWLHSALTCLRPGLITPPEVAALCDSWRQLLHEGLNSTAGPARSNAGGLGQHPVTQHSSMQHSSMQHTSIQHSSMQHGSMEHPSVQHASMGHVSMDSDSLQQHGLVQHGSIERTGMEVDAVPGTLAAASGAFAGVPAAAAGGMGLSTGACIGVSGAAPWLQAFPEFKAPAAGAWGSLGIGAAFSGAFSPSFSSGPKLGVRVRWLARVCPRFHWYSSLRLFTYVHTVPHKTYTNGW